MAGATRLPDGARDSPRPARPDCSRRASTKRWPCAYEFEDLGLSQQALTGLAYILDDLEIEAADGDDFEVWRTSQRLDWLRRREGITLAPLMVHLLETLHPSDVLPILHGVEQAKAPKRQLLRRAQQFLDGYA